MARRATFTKNVFRHAPWFMPLANPWPLYLYESHQLPPRQVKGQQARQDHNSENQAKAQHQFIAEDAIGRAHHHGDMVKRKNIVGIYDNIAKKRHHQGVYNPGRHADQTGQYHREGSHTAANEHVQRHGDHSHG